MEDLEKPEIGCRINSCVKGDLGCQLCWLSDHGDPKCASREECMRRHMGDLKPRSEIK